MAAYLFTVYHIFTRMILHPICVISGTLYNPFIQDNDGEPLKA
jgi:hypothetical protein